MVSLFKSSLILLPVTTAISFEPIFVWAWLIYHSRYNNIYHSRCNNILFQGWAASSVFWVELCRTYSVYLNQNLGNKFCPVSTVCLLAHFAWQNSEREKEKTNVYRWVKVNGGMFISDPRCKIWEGKFKNNQSNVGRRRFDFIDNGERIKPMGKGWLGRPIEKSFSPFCGYKCQADGRKNRLDGRKPLVETVGDMNPAEWNLIWKWTRSCGWDTVAR